jgi:signal transduction histidine kinase
VREYLQMISRENERLSRLIENFLAFSRMERNKQAFEKVRVEPAEVARAAAEAVTERRAAEASRLDVEIAPDLPDIVGDREALSTVIVNLLDNACKYSDNDEEIVLRAYGENGRVVFDVEDHGIGLSRRAAKRVFERFYQVDSDLSRRGSGVGLGLAIVKFIVDAHGGEVSVTSQAGVGSTFRVKLPAVQDIGAET